MKRYTGQQALYEAISRSRAKAKQGSILERLSPEDAKQEKKASEERQPQAESRSAPLEAAPAGKEESQRRRLPEKLRRPAVLREAAKLRRPTVRKVQTPPEKKPAVEEKKPPVVEKKTERVAPPRPPHMWWRVKPIQLNAGRVEISAPYHVSIAVGLGVLLVVLAAFRIGQSYPGARIQAAAADTPVRMARQNAAVETTATGRTQDEASSASSSSAASAQSTGDHWIVLAQGKNRADLEEVMKYYAAHGIELSVYDLAHIRRRFEEYGVSTANLPNGDGYLLATTGLYSNPYRPGSDGNDILQKIIKLGKDYKAPAGRGSFAARHFSDAYGIKIQ